MLGVCAEAAMAKSNTVTTRTPGRNQHCRGTLYRFIGTSLHEGGEVARCLPCAAVPATPSYHRASRPWRATPSSRSEAQAAAGSRRLHAFVRPATGRGPRLISLHLRFVGAGREVRASLTLVAAHSEPSLSPPDSLDAACTPISSVRRLDSLCLTP